MIFNRDNVQISVTAEDEDITVEQVAKDCHPGFAESVRKMQKQSKRWGWCSVKVSVRPKVGNTSIVGDNYLGACSYSSKQDFIDNSGYYEDMVDEAIEELNKNYILEVQNLVDTLRTFASGETQELAQQLNQCAKALRAKYQPLVE